MNATYPIAAVAELIGEPARAAILIALTDGRALPAGELARAAAVSAQSASAHLSKLVAGGLLTVQREGRHRYYTMASPDVGHAVEALGVIATNPRAAGQPRPPEARALYNLRSCYDHLAGRVAVELASAFENSRMIQLRGERDYELGPEGPIGFEAFGLNTAALRSSRRRFARRCLDWTERRPHVAGALGAAILSRLIALGWVARLPKTRALRITHRGAGELEGRFGILTRA
ncbi:MAG TPA: helix-turn-helix transcriptional regulator [Vicinamibacteria bacterium]|nr:helix-turn-helix transcriptional regulator [Vicinamibacteria bacterium]